MKKLIIPLIFLILLTPVYALYDTNSSLIDDSEWLTNMKSIYSDYIDSGLFFVVAVAIFFPIIIGGLSGLAIGRGGHVSRFVLELILGILMFLLFPYLVDVLVGVL